MKFETINGFKIVFCDFPAPIVSVRAIINAGSYQDQKEGAAHFLEHLFFKGTQKHNYQEINQALAAIGNSNAYTSVDRTVYYIDTIPNHITAAFDYLCEMLFLPAMATKEMEKNVLLS